MAAQKPSSLKALVLPGVLALVALLCGCARQQKAQQQKPEIPGPRQTDLFTGGEGGYASYRIPALIATAQGAVLAFVEGRKASSADHGDHDILMRRSTDGGKTWGPVQVVMKGETYALNNPTAVVDRSTGTTWLFFVKTSTRKYKTDADLEKAKGPVSRMLVMHSNDGGATWSRPRDITKSVNRPGWRRIIPGPGVGIQMKSGRLVIPCNHEVGPVATDHVMYSDDHGKTWRLGGSTEDKTDEDQIVQLADGSLMLNIRNYREKGHRGISISKDGGLTWSPVEADPTLIEPVCMASLIRYTEAPEFSKNRLLFSNPASQTKRIKMTVRVSYDEGKTWPVAKELNAGPSGYSCLTVLPDMKIGCLYERGERSSVDEVTFARFSLAWLTDGADSIHR